LKPKKKNCYTCNVPRDKCKKLPRSVGDWLKFVCDDWEPREMGKVVLMEQKCNGDEGVKHELVFDKAAFSSFESDVERHCKARNRIHDIKNWIMFYIYGRCQIVLRNQFKTNLSDYDKRYLEECKKTVDFYIKEIDKLADLQAPYSFDTFVHEGENPDKEGKKDVRNS
jgi:hypothetical protein